MSSYWSVLEQWVLFAPGAKVLVGALGSLVLGISLIVAIREFRFFRELDDPNSFVDALIKEANLHKGTPKKIATIRKKITRIEEVQESAWRFMRGRFARLGVYGYLVPSILLFSFCLTYGWFDGSTAAFVRLLTDEFVNAPTPWEILVFVFAQLTKGALLDVLEVFKLEPSAITNNPANIPFSSFILLFRGFVGVFSGVLALFVYRALRARVKANGIAAHKLDELRNLLAEAKA